MGKIKRHGRSVIHSDEKWQKAISHYTSSDSVSVNNVARTFKINPTLIKNRLLELGLYRVVPLGKTVKVAFEKQRLKPGRFTHIK